MKYSTPSKISYGSDARSRSNPIPRCPVRGILLLPRLQWTPDYPQLGPLTIHGGAHPTKLPQGVRPHPSGDFPTAKYTLSKIRMQSTSIRRSTDFLTPIHTVYALQILPLCIALMRIKIIQCFTFCSTAVHPHTMLMGYPPLGCPHGGDSNISSHVPR